MTKNLQGSSHHLKIVGFRLCQTKRFYYEKINKLIRSSNKVLFGILLSEKCNDNELKAYDANLDFTEADIVELRKAYAV